ncbi:hypothetical protein BABINDRAFT_162766 [Babjeviella inositovora NRRL Y-12698]|uniref:RRM domain-containing protein n=1 Tax=Babjeviella inositovora NRRL Y-12698 TaxID=984486 RepID=A0A1E3QLI1_9ASCO|nr:uncharacterized protein BABINDRAFT_162766 [Babjeviella inositovora NRRL Y-12698]ODQ78559.1 hypothetical protein BABINDRAFT_162766 [Babjeviella inositovora NRRL Y-12698]
MSKRAAVTPSPNPEINSLAQAFNNFQLGPALPPGIPPPIHIIGLPNDTSADDLAELLNSFVDENTYSELMLFNQPGDESDCWASLVVHDSYSLDKLLHVLQDYGWKGKTVRAVIPGFFDNPYAYELPYDEAAIPANPYMIPVSPPPNPMMPYFPMNPAQAPVYMNKYPPMYPLFPLGFVPYGLEAPRMHLGDIPGDFNRGLKFEDTYSPHRTPGRFASQSPRVTPSSLVTSPSGGMSPVYGYGAHSPPLYSSNKQGRYPNYYSPRSDPRNRTSLHYNRNFPLKFEQPMEFPYPQWYPANQYPSPMNRSQFHGGNEVFDPRRLFVGNIPYTTTWMTVKQHLRLAGNVVRVDVPADSQREYGLSKGFAIAIFETAEGATRAIEELDESVLEGRIITVRYDRMPYSRGNHRSYQPYNRQHRDGYGEGILGSLQYIHDIIDERGGTPENTPASLAVSGTKEENAGASTPKDHAKAQENIGLVDESKEATLARDLVDSIDVGN